MKRIVILSVAVLVLTTFVKAQNHGKEIGGNIGGNYLIGDSPIEASDPMPNFGIFGIYHFSPKLSLKLQAGYGFMKTAVLKTQIKTSFVPFELIAMYNLKSQAKFLPFIHGGIGAMNFKINNSNRFNDGIFIGGAGLKTSLSANVSLLLTADMRLTTGDGFNWFTGGLPDGYFSLQAGVSYNLSKPQQFEKPEKQKGNIIAQVPATQPQQQNMDDIQAFLQQKSKIDQLKADLDKKNAQIEELKNLVKIKNQKIQLYETQVADLRNQQQPIQGKKNQEQFADYSKVPVKSKEISDKGFTVQQRYNNALNNFNARNYRTAIAEFTELANSYPNHKLASNFLYWIGESYFGLNNYGAALEAFKNVTNYSKSPKYDDALLMSGLSYLKLGDSSKAKEMFEELLQKFPNSEYTGKARHYLQNIKPQIIS